MDKSKNNSSKRATGSMSQLLSSEELTLAFLLDNLSLSRTFKNGKKEVWRITLHKRESKKDGRCKPNTYSYYFEKKEEPGGEGYGYEIYSDCPYQLLGAIAHNYQIRYQPVSGGSSSIFKLKNKQEKGTENILLFEKLNTPLISLIHDYFISSHPKREPKELKVIGKEIWEKCLLKALVIENNNEEVLKSHQYPEDIEEASVSKENGSISSLSSPPPSKLLPSAEDELKTQVFLEGGKKAFFTTTYERDPVLRKNALEIHGLTCKVCGFNFKDTYGEPLGSDFAEVHHIIPVSEGERENNVGNLVPLCSNCHRMIHRLYKYLTLEQYGNAIELLKEKIEKNKEQSKEKQ